jgi:hypothetical protein
MTEKTHTVEQEHEVGSHRVGKFRVVSVVSAYGYARVSPPCLMQDSLDSLQGDLVPEQPEVEYRRVGEVVEGGYDV